MRRVLVCLSLIASCLTAACGSLPERNAGSGDRPTASAAKSDLLYNRSSTVDGATGAARGAGAATGAGAASATGAATGASNSSSVGTSAGGNEPAAGAASSPTNNASAFEALGFISDSTCGANHSFMIKTGSMGETDESCVKECVRAGSRFVFVSTDGKHIFKLKDQDSAAKFAGRKVKVLGNLCAYGKELDQVKILPVESVPPVMPVSTK